MEFTQYPGIEAKRAEMKTKIKDKPPVIGKKLWEYAMKSWKSFTPEQMQQLDYESRTAHYVLPDGFKSPYRSYATSVALVVSSPMFIAVPVQDILWIFPSVIKQSTNLIPTSKEFHLSALSREGYTHTLYQVTKGPISKNDPSQEALENIRRILQPVCPGIIFGWSEQVSRMVDKDFAGLVAYVDQQNMAARQNMGAQQPMQQQFMQPPMQ